MLASWTSVQRGTRDEARQRRQRVLGGSAHVLLPLPVPQLPAPRHLLPEMVRLNHQQNPAKLFSSAGVAGAGLERGALPASEIAGLKKGSGPLRS